MVYDFLITLKKPDYRFVDQVSQLMYIFAILAFGIYYYQYQKSGLIYLIIIIGILLSWIYTVYKKNKNGTAFFRLGLIIAAAGWLIGPELNLWMGILYALSGILEKQVKFPKEVGFSEKDISFNTFPRKVIQWSDINNALIKDGILTIDQKNNQLFQKEIEGYVTTDIENEFNDFCRRCLHTPDTIPQKES